MFSSCNRKKNVETDKLGILLKTDSYWYIPMQELNGIMHVYVCMYEHDMNTNE